MMKTVDGQIYLFSDHYFRLTFFTLLDLAMIGLWLIILFLILFYIRSQRQTLEYYKYFIPGFLFKVVFSILFALVYIFYYGGGDSIMYWDGAVCMNRLFFHAPEKYLLELFLNYDKEVTRNPFMVYNKFTEFPSWPLLYESESYFVIKITSFLTFITGKSYLAINLFISFLGFLASWRLFEYLRTILNIPDKQLVFALVFIPSVVFWTSAVSKDAYLFISILVFVRVVLQLLRNDAKSKLYNLFFMVFHLFMIYQIRPIVLLTVLTPIVLVLGLRYANRFKEHPFFRRLLLTLLYGFSLITLLIVLQGFGVSSKLEGFLQEAEVVQQDFTKNTLYTGKRYMIEVEDYTYIGLIKALPQSVIAGMYRPFPWEALSPVLLLNGLESALLLWMTYRFFRRKARQKLRTIVQHEFLYYALIFVITLAFITGFSSILFGVLVRLRAPLLPFLFILLAVAPTEKTNFVPELPTHEDNH